MSSKQKIPKALREQVWIVHAGKVFERKCLTDWCNNTMTVFDFQCGHNVPESKNGKTDISNLVPICSRCNLSMGSQFTFTEWRKQSKVHTTVWTKIVSKLFGTKVAGIRSTRSLTNQLSKHSKLRGVLSEIPKSVPKKRTEATSKNAEMK
jgi:5-methylcytosine-specific restriction endonuclease McrA